MPGTASLYGPPTRTGSGRDRLSTLITSAPKSLNSLVENGPAPAQVRSTKRMPLRNCGYIGFLLIAPRRRQPAPHRHPAEAPDGRPATAAPTVGRAVRETQRHCPDPASPPGGRNAGTKAADQLADRRSG